MTNSRRLYDAYFQAAVAASQAFIAVVAGGCRGFRTLVVTTPEGQQAASARSRDLGAFWR